MTAIQVASGKGDGGLQRQVCSCHSPCTLPTMALVLSLGSWLLLFVVELAANASEGEELLHDTRLVAYLASVGFAAVTCILLLILCARSATRASYQSVIPAKDDRISGNDRRMPLLWHYLIHGTLVTATICWIAIHSAMLQHQQVWRGVITLYSLLSLSLLCYTPRPQPTEAWDPTPVSLGILGHGLQQKGGKAAASPKSGPRRVPGVQHLERWKPLFQDPTFCGEVPDTSAVRRCASLPRYARDKRRSFVFEEQAEAVLSPVSPSQGWTLPTTYQKNLNKLRGLAARRLSDGSEHGSWARRSSFASSDQGSVSNPVSPTHPLRQVRTQSQVSASSGGFSDVSDVGAGGGSPLSPTLALYRTSSKESRRVSKDRRDSRNSAYSDSAMSDISDAPALHTMDHAQVCALASVDEEDDRQIEISPRGEPPQLAVPVTAATSSSAMPRPEGEALVDEDLADLAGSGSNQASPSFPLALLSIPAFAEPSIDSHRTINSDCVSGILRDLEISKDDEPTSKPSLEVQSRQTAPTVGPVEQQDGLPTPEPGWRQLPGAV